MRDERFRGAIPRPTPEEQAGLTDTDDAGDTTPPTPDVGLLDRVADDASRGLSIAETRTERAQAAGAAVGLTALLGLI